jgi:hypothetical protein
MTDPTYRDYADARRETMRHIGMLEPLSAALRDDGETLHQHVAKLDAERRGALFHACAMVMNALAAADAEFDRLRRYARQLSPTARATLQAYAESDGTTSHVPAVEANALRIGGLVTPDGAVTSDGREVLRLLEVEAILRTQVQDRALSDEDFCHE